MSQVNVYTGIEEHPGLLQPFTVRHKGAIVWFARTKIEAELVLRAVKGYR